MNQKLYIPEISDQLILTEDWSFTLHSEQRNKDLGAFFGYYVNYYDGWIPEAVLPPMRDPDFTVTYPNRNDSHFRLNYDSYQAACRAVEQSNPEYVKYYEDFEIWRKEVDKVIVKDLIVTIPKGTILQVDRIYIRKGASDFSSITFYAKNLGEIESQRSPYSSNKKKVKKKALRFWAKLSDCNTIAFTKTESHDSSHGISKSVAKILKDRGLTIEDIIVIDSVNLTASDLIEKYKSIPNGKIVLIENFGNQQDSKK